METIYETNERKVRELEETVKELELEAEGQSDAQEKGYIEEEIKELEKQIKEKN